MPSSPVAMQGSDREETRYDNTVTASPSPLESEKRTTARFSLPRPGADSFFSLCFGSLCVLLWPTRFQSELQEWTSPENGELIAGLDPPGSRVAVPESSQQWERVQQLAGLSQPNSTKLHEKVWLMGR